VKDLRDASAEQAFPTALIGGGMLTYFTELNRKRQSREGIDFIGHATCPIVHRDLQARLIAAE
jgi:D-apionolactonase